MPRHTKAPVDTDRLLEILDCTADRALRPDELVFLRGEITRLDATRRSSGGPQAALQRARDELAKLHAGEEPYEDVHTVASPAQWIWQWNRATLEKRLQVAAAVQRDGATARMCAMADHAGLAERTSRWVGRASTAETALANLLKIADKWNALDSKYLGKSAVCDIVMGTANSVLNPKVDDSGREQPAVVHRATEQQASEPQTVDQDDEFPEVLVRIDNQLRLNLAAVIRSKWDAWNCTPDEHMAAEAAMDYLEAGPLASTGEESAVRGVQGWMALDLHTALRLPFDPRAEVEHQGHASWADWWADLCADVRRRPMTQELHTPAAPCARCGHAPVAHSERCHYTAALRCSCAAYEPQTVDEQLNAGLIEAGFGMTDLRKALQRGAALADYLAEHPTIGGDISAQLLRDAIALKPKCCVCGSLEVAYRNWREQPFCWPCADGHRPEPEPQCTAACSEQHLYEGGCALDPVGLGNGNIERLNRGSGAWVWSCDEGHDMRVSTGQSSAPAARRAYDRHRRDDHSEDIHPDSLAVNPRPETASPQASDAASGDNLAVKVSGHPGLTINAATSGIMAIGPQPMSFVVPGDDGQSLVTIRPSGELEYGPGYEPDEAAHRFWSALTRAGAVGRDSTETDPESSIAAGRRVGQRTTEVVHLCPARGNAAAPCCGTSLLELPRTDRVTEQRERVTCGRPAGEPLRPVDWNGHQPLPRRQRLQPGLIRDLIDGARAQHTDLDVQMTTATNGGDVIHVDTSTAIGRMLADVYTKRMHQGTEGDGKL